VGLDPSGQHLSVTRAPEPGEAPEGGDHDVIDAEIVEE
jgi:ATP-dependent Clp protease ATP-binding subunit ClpB